jgi:hypothetical protein
VLVAGCGKVIVAVGWGTAGVVGTAAGGAALEGAGGTVAVEGVAGWLEAVGAGAGAAAGDRGTRRVCLGGRCFAGRGGRVAGRLIGASSVATESGSEDRPIRWPASWLADQANAAVSTIPSIAAATETNVRRVIRTER